jgi:hypothetical protein
MSQNTQHAKPQSHSGNEKQTNNDRLTLALADTDGAATATGGLGVLALDTEAPVVTETTVGADLLQPLEILASLAVEAVGHNMVILAVVDVALPVQEPGWDLVLRRVLEDRDDTLELFGGEFTGAGEVSGCPWIPLAVLRFCPPGGSRM